MTNQLTVRGVDDALHRRLKSEAQNLGLSVNQYVLEILREAAGQVEKSAPAPRYHDLDDLAGSWDDAAFAEFEALTADQRQIDEALWP